VVIAIISVLSGIIATNVKNISNKARVARVNIEATNLSKALYAFYSKYGDYPCNFDDCFPEYGFCVKMIISGEGEPSLYVNGANRYLSEFLKMDWSLYNAKYFSNTAYYVVRMYDSDTSGKVEVDCGYIELYDNYGYYGRKGLICGQNCLECSNDQPFQANRY
jgi:hypothetical protein